MSTEATRITVYTWPYQWVYEPAYYALEHALVEHNRVSERFRIEWTTQNRTGEQFKTDSEVISALHSHNNHDGVNPAIAICQPSGAETKCRLIPILWRLPVWTYVPRIIRDSAEKGSKSLSRIIPHSLSTLQSWLANYQKFEIYRFAEDSTAGDIAKALLILLGDKEHKWRDTRNDQVLPYAHEAFLNNASIFNNTKPAQRRKRAVPVRTTLNEFWTPSKIWTVSGCRL